MKVALVHDYIKEYGGAERVLEALHDIYPNATVFTTVYLPDYLGPHKERFKKWKIKTSWLQYLPFKQKLISPMRLLSSQVFRMFDFSGYDLILTSATGAYFPNALNKEKAKLICYCHTPPRYLYGYATAREWKKNKILNSFGELANHFLRMTDFNASRHVDFYIANSEEVKARIEKFYRRDAIVIYPPATLSFARRAGPPVTAAESESYFVAGGRLARPKHIDLIIKTLKQMKLPLKVFGKSFAGYGKELEKMAGSETEFLGEVTDEEKVTLLKGAKAYVFASEDEDFGILPVEAMACGTPVIAYRSGGVKETVVEGKTGLFYDELTKESLESAITKFEKMKFDPKVCREQAEKFSEDRFKREIKKFVEKASK